MNLAPAHGSVIEQINCLHAVAVRMAGDSRNALRMALSAAWKAGQLLSAEKKRVRKQMGHGAWGDWLDANFDGSVRTAQRYMCLAASIADTRFLRGLSLRQAYFRLGIATEPKSRRDAVAVPPLPEPVRLAGRLIEALRSEPPQCRDDLRPLFEELRRWFEPANNSRGTVSILSWPSPPR
ncbi:MAG: hypothetical protein HZC55_00825 [Verrucomicrobia bacterium]|nr:hypothetical protein [Verrucomicrobiota bacterium]